MKDNSNNKNEYIFTDAESIAIEKRKNSIKKGKSADYSDKTGAFSRAAFKISQIIRMTDSLEKRNNLYKLIEDRRLIKKEVKAKPNEEMSFEDFKKEHTY